MYKHKIQIVLILVAIFGISCATASEATEDSSLPNETVNVQAELEKAEELFKQREDTAKLEKAVKTLQAARNPNNRNFEVEWKYSQYNYFLGKRSKSEKDQIKAFEEGEKAGKIASRVEPKKPDGYFWYAANLGEQAKISPVTVGAVKVDDIKEAMLKVVEIQPDYQGASAYDGLARIELETSGVIGNGTPEKAAEYAEKGVELEKNNSNLRITLAKAYLALDRDADARKQLEYVLKMEPDPGYKVEYEANVEEANKLLKEKF